MVEPESTTLAEIRRCTAEPNARPTREQTQWLLEQYDAQVARLAAAARFIVLYRNNCSWCTPRWRCGVCADTETFLAALTPESAHA